MAAKRMGGVPFHKLRATGQNNVGVHVHVRGAVVKCTAGASMIPNIL